MPAWIRLQKFGVLVCECMVLALDWLRLLELQSGFIAGVLDGIVYAVSRASCALRRGLSTATTSMVAGLGSVVVGGYSGYQSRGLEHWSGQLTSFIHHSLAPGAWKVASAWRRVWVLAWSQAAVL